MTNPTWIAGFFEFFIVVAFAAGWGVLEWKGRQLDKQSEERARAKAAAEQE
jgi:hypothetical protein